MHQVMESVGIFAICAVVSALIALGLMEKFYPSSSVGDDAIGWSVNTVFAMLLAAMVGGCLGLYGWHH